MVSLDEMSFKSRTETSAKRWQEKEGGSQHQHMPPLLRDTLTNCFKSSTVQSFLFIIIIIIKEFR